MAYNKAQVTIDLEEYQALLDAQKSLTNNRWYKAVQVLAQLIPLVADQYRKPLYTSMEELGVTIRIQKVEGTYPAQWKATVQEAELRDKSITP